MSVTLSHADLVLIQAAQRALLSVPMEAESETSEANSHPHATWVDGVAAALRPLFGTDHVYYTEPLGESPRTADSLFVRHPMVGAEFEGRLQQHFESFEDGFTQFADDTTTMIRRLVRSAGAGAFHDAPLYDARRQAASRLHQDVFRPVGVVRKLALSVPLQVGEAMLVFGYSSADTPGFEGRRHRLLELLLPAFEAGLRIRRHLERQSLGLETVTGGAPIPILFLDREGRERHRNPAFDALVGRLDAGETPLSSSRTGAGLTSVDELLTTARTLARRLTKKRGPADARPRLLSTTPADVAPGTATQSIGAFRLRASLGTTYQGRPGVLIFVETPLTEPPPRSFSGRTVLPRVADVEAATDLTDREAEVSLLIAEGRTDKEIAERLTISVHTARRHAGSILKKLALTSRAGVAVALLRATS